MALDHPSVTTGELRNRAIFLGDLADAELDSGNAATAESHLRDALQMLPDKEIEVMVGCMTRLGKVLLKQGNWQDAEKVARGSRHFPF